MELQPVRRYTAPAFPTRAILDAHPELLRLVPKRWRGNPAVLSALASVFLLTATRGSIAADRQVSSRVAPIFQHGSGLAQFGGKPAPPTFLSEEEARKIIIEEARKAGVSFATEAPTIAAVPLAALDAPTGAPKQKIAIQLDGIDTKRHIAFEYVSETDMLAWHRTPHDGLITTYDLHGTAEDLRAALACVKPQGAYAVFYDPYIGYADVLKQNPEVKWKDISKQATVLAGEELRKQVRDFIVWLKAQGVI